MTVLLDQPALSPLFGSALLDVIIANNQSIVDVARILKVVGIVLEHGGQEHDAIATMFVQQVRDASVTVPQIRQDWGDVVADIVDEVVENQEPFNSFPIALIAAATALDELRSISNDPDQWSTHNHQVYCNLIERVKDHAPPRIFSELCFWVSAIWDDMSELQPTPISFLGASPFLGREGWE